MLSKNNKSSDSPLLLYTDTTMQYLLRLLCLTNVIHTHTHTHTHIYTHTSIDTSMILLMICKIEIKHHKHDTVIRHICMTINSKDTYH